MGTSAMKKPSVHQSELGCLWYQSVTSTICNTVQWNETQHSNNNIILQW